MRDLTWLGRVRYRQSAEQAPANRPLRAAGPSPLRSFHPVAATSRRHDPPGQLTSRAARLVASVTNLEPGRRAQHRVEVDVRVAHVQRLADELRTASELEVIPHSRRR